MGSRADRTSSRRSQAMVRSTSSRLPSISSRHPFISRTVAPPQRVQGEIECVSGGVPVDCATVPGLSQALVSQGRGDLADRIGPTLPLEQGYIGHAGDGYATETYQQEVFTPGPVTERFVTQTYTTEAYAPPAYHHPQHTVPCSTCRVAHQPQAVTVPCSTCRVIHQPQPVAVPCGTCQVVHRPAPAPVVYTVRLADGTAFALNGGVGAGVYGGYSGGGGTFISGGSRFSGVLDARASAFTFNRRVKRGGGGHNPHPRPHPHPGGGGGGCGGGCPSGH